MLSSLSSCLCRVLQITTHGLPVYAGGLACGSGNVADVELLRHVDDRKQIFQLLGVDRNPKRLDADVYKRQTPANALFFAALGWMNAKTGFSLGVWVLLLMPVMRCV